MINQYKYTIINAGMDCKYEGIIRIKEDDKYKRGTTAGIVILCSLILLAANGMGLINEIYIIIKDSESATATTSIRQPTEVKNYFVILLELWSISTNILALICAIGQNMTFWRNLRIYMGVVLGVYVAYDIYASIQMVEYLTVLEDLGLKEETFFLFLFYLITDALFVLRQICFLTLYKLPVRIYLLPIYSILGV